MPDRLIHLLGAVEGTWDGMLMHIAGSGIFPAINSTGKAAVLVVTLATTVFGAGFGVALTLSGYVGLPDRVLALEASVTRTEQYVCEIRMSMLGLDPIVCYRAAPDE